MFRHSMNRRSFIAVLIAAFAALAGLVSIRLHKSNFVRKLPEKSRVVSAFHPNASSAGKGLDNTDLDESIVRQMVNAGVLAFTGEKDLKRAWRAIIPDPGKKVAIKINCQIQGVYTKAKVVWPLVEGLAASGVPDENIIIYDMTDTAFDLAGFKRQTGSGVQVGKVTDF